MVRYEIDKKTSQVLNILKLISMVFVVYIHSSSGGRVNFKNVDINMQSSTIVNLVRIVISSVIARMAVPCFFFIASILLYKRDFTWFKNTKKKLKSILIPYVIINLFWILAFFLMQSFNFTKPYFSNAENLIRFFTISDWIKAFIPFEGGMPFYYPFWFLKDLFILNLFSILIKIMVDHFPKVIIVLSAMIYVFNINLVLISSEACFFFVIGYYVVKYKLDFFNLIPLKKHTINYAYILLVILTTISIFNDWQNIFVTIIGIITKIFGILFFINISNRIAINSKFSSNIINLSQYTFIIYSFHEMTLTILTKLFTRYLPQTSIIQIIQFLLLPIIVIILCIIFGIFLKKYTPKIYNLITGSR